MSFGPLGRPLRQTARTERARMSEVVNQQFFRLFD